jgi:hypothetical protein
MVWGYDLNSSVSEYGPVAGFCKQNFGAYKILVNSLVAERFVASHAGLNYT